MPAILRKQVDNDLVESVRKTNLRKVYDHLTKAGEYYAFVQQSLNERQEKQQLTDVERKTLRNCYFAIGADLVRTGRFRECDSILHGGKHALPEQS